MNNAYTLLQKHFKLRDFRPGQKTIIEALFQGRDVFALMQTGAGKSLCFQIPALAAKGTCIVICPLISLMYDQVRTLKKNGISAEFLNSQQDYKTRVDVEKRLKEGKLKFLYVAPERILTDRLFDILKAIEISMIIYDEAHVITEWGEAFRPAYITALDKIKQLELFKAKLLSNPNFRFQKAVFSASIIKDARADIINKSNLVRPSTFIHSFARNNINLHVLKYHNDKRGKLDILVDALKCKEKKTSIIYAGSRKECETISGRLSVRGIKATYYHAGLPSKDRKFKMDLFMRSKVDVIVCTSAFGMGIDKKNVRQVFHWALPTTIEDMYQEMGRAGRDGLKSDHFTFYDKADIQLAKDRLIANYPTAEAVEKSYHFIRVYTRKINSNNIEEDKTFLADIIGSPVTKEQITAIFDHFIRIGFLTEIKSASNPQATQSNKQRMFEVNDDIDNLLLDSVDKRHQAAHRKHQALLDYFESNACRSMKILNYLGDPDINNLSDTCTHCDNCVSSLKVTAKPSSNLTVSNNKPSGREGIIEKRIKGLVNTFAKKNKIPSHIVLPPLCINKITRLNPKTESELKNIGLPDKTVKELGKTFIKIIEEVNGHEKK